MSRSHRLQSADCQSDNERRREAISPCSHISFLDNEVKCEEENEEFSSFTCSWPGTRDSSSFPFHLLPILLVIVVYSRQKVSTTRVCPEFSRKERRGRKVRREGNCLFRPNKILPSFFLVPLSLWCSSPVNPFPSSLLLWRKSRKVNVREKHNKIEKRCLQGKFGPFPLSSCSLRKGTLHEVSRPLHLSPAFPLLEWLLLICFSPLNNIRRLLQLLSPFPSVSVYFWARSKIVSVLLLPLLYTTSLFSSPFYGRTAHSLKPLFLPTTSKVRDNYKRR